MSDHQPFGPPPAPGAPPPPPAVRPSSGREWSATRPVVGTHLVTDQRPPNGAVVAIAWVVTVLTLGYMLPWAIAATRGTSNQAAVGLVNLLLGWTFVGWVVALVMAGQAHRVAGVGVASTVIDARQTTYNGTASGSAAPAGWYPAPDGPGHRSFDGARWTEHRAT